MKTNQNLVRKMGDFEVIQRSKDSMFNATALLKQWNEYSGMKKEVRDFFSNKQTSEFIEVLVEEENLDTGNVPYVKSRASRGKNAGTWMHPFLFIKFAMWLNPRFEYQVIKFVYDELVKHRHAAGDNYKMLCCSLSKFPEVDYRELGKMLNHVVFGIHEKALRNKATPEQQEDLQQLERDLSNYIDMGFITTYDQFKNILRDEYNKRHKKLNVA